MKKNPLSPKRIYHWLIYPHVKKQKDLVVLLYSYKKADRPVSYTDIQVYEKLKKYFKDYKISFYEYAPPVRGLSPYTVITLKPKTEQGKKELAAADRKNFKFEYVHGGHALAFSYFEADDIKMKKLKTILDGFAKYLELGPHPIQS